jgi:hypothetical protein
MGSAHIGRSARRTAAALAATVACLLVPLARAADAGAVRDSKLEETIPTANGAFLAWTQNSKRHPKHHDVYARRFGSKTVRFKVNATQTSGFTGGIDQSTDTLVYTQIRKGQADLKLFDLDTRKRSGIPGANTPAVEFFPSVSGNRILFTRFANATSTYSIILYNRTSHQSQVLWTGKDFAASAEVNGIWSVWNVCPVGAACNVYRHNSTSGSTVRVPNLQDMDQYAPSVTPAGTVFFARSGTKFTAHSRLVRYPFGGPAEIVFALETGTGIGSTFAYTRSGPSTTVYYDRYKKSTNQWNIYDLVAPGEAGPIIRSPSRPRISRAGASREVRPAKAGAGFPRH